MSRKTIAAAAALALLILSPATQAADKVDPEKYCSAVRSISSGLQESVAYGHKTSAGSIRLLRVIGYEYSALAVKNVCRVMLDTPKGPEPCAVDVYKDSDGTFIAHGTYYSCGPLS